MESAPPNSERRRRREPLTNSSEGKPLIRDTDISVEFLLSLLVHGQTPQQILLAHLALTLEDLRACLVFAYQAIAQDT